MNKEEVVKATMQKLSEIEKHLQALVNLILYRKGKGKLKCQSEPSRLRLSSQKAKKFRLFLQ